MRSGAGLPDQPAGSGRGSGAAAARCAAGRAPRARGGQFGLGGCHVVMQWVGNLSLRAKLRVIVVYAAAAAVLIAGVLYASGEVLTLRRSQAQQLLTLVTAVGDNAAAPLKTFNRALARKVLASLHDDPDIRAAALYDAAGNLFADVSFSKETGSPSDRLRDWAIDAAGGDLEAI